MVLPDFLKFAEGTSIVLAGSGHAPGATAKNNLGADTDLITLASLADDAARQSDQFDFGDDRPTMLMLSTALEFAATPTPAETVEFWLAYSMHATPGQASPGNTTGVDGAWSGYNSNIATSILHLYRAGIMSVTADITPTVQVVIGLGLFVPFARYASLVIINKSGAALHSDNVEMSVAFDPVEHKTVDT